MNYLFPVIVALLVMTTGFTTAYAAHGAGGAGGGCGSDCKPPTLGVDEKGNAIVRGGLSINSVPFDVELFSQEIPNQILNQNEKSVITLKISENNGPDFVTHAELHFAPTIEVISGVQVEKSASHLVWDSKQGDEIIGVYDDAGIVENVLINAKNEDNLKIISFEFEPRTTLDETTIMTIVWDQKRNPVKNYFIDAIKIVDSNKVTLLPDSDVIAPAWIKNTAGWWADGKINDKVFLDGIEYMIKSDILIVETENVETENVETENVETENQSTPIPNWIKNSSKLWSDGIISDAQFIHSMQFLVSNQIINIT